MPVHLPFISRFVDHASLEVSVAAVRALRRYPVSVSEPIFRRLLGMPARHFRGLMQTSSTVLRVELRQRVLHVIAQQSQPSESLLRSLHEQLVDFDGIHGDDDLGCLDQCWDRCHDGLDEENTPAVVTQSCRHECHRCVGGASQWADRSARWL